MKLLMLSVCLVVSALGAQLSVSSAIEGIERRYNRPRTMQLSFSQTYTWQGRPPRTENGELFLRKPRRMRWEYNTPAGKLFLSDGKDVYFYSPSAHRVEKMPLKESGDMRTPLAFLMGRLDLRRDFREFRSRPQEGNLHIIALPKSKKSPYEHVVFVVTPEFRIIELVIRSADGSVMEFEFTNEKVNPPLAQDVFQFEMPEGAEFVELTGDEAE